MTGDMVTGAMATGALEVKREALAEAATEVADTHQEATEKIGKGLRVCC